VLEHQWLIGFTIKKFNYKNMNMFKDDIINAGNIGLIKAYYRFNPNRNSDLTKKPVKFSTYAYYYVYSEI